MKEIREGFPGVLQSNKAECRKRSESETGIMDQPQIHPDVRRPGNDAVYQIAIIIAALLLVITASLF